MISAGSFASVFVYTFVCVIAHFVHLRYNNPQYYGTNTDLGGQWTDIDNQIVMFSHLQHLSRSIIVVSLKACKSLLHPQTGTVRY